MGNEQGENLKPLPMEAEPHPTAPPPTLNGDAHSSPKEEEPVRQSEEGVFVSASESLSESEQNPKTEEDEDDVAEDAEEDEIRLGKKPKLLPVKEEMEEREQGVEEAKPETASPLLQNDEAKPKPKPKPKKKKKKTPNSVWMTRSTRKGKKKAKPNPQGATPAEDKVLITPVPRFFDKGDDSPEAAVCLSKVYKAEKVELSDDRMSAGSSKGYRMVRATRGVCEGAWYFEIRVMRLGDTGHTRLGWSTEKGDLQAPVGYDANSFGYRDVDGSKVHKALREKYGQEGYKEGDVLGFYINLPDGGSFAPKPPQLVWYKGQRYLCAQDPKDGPPKIVPGSEISFFKNGVCQGVAFKDLYGGRYYPAASIYTLPCQPNCEVKFNFGPDFEFFPEDFGGRPAPRPMVEVPYHGYDCRAENGTTDEK